MAASWTVLHRRLPPVLSLRHTVVVVDRLDVTNTHVIYQNISIQNDINILFYHTSLTPVLYIYAIMLKLVYK